MRTKNNQAGFSYIEVVLYMAVFVIFMAGIIEFSFIMISARAKTQTVYEVRYNAGFVMNYIVSDIRQTSLVLGDKSVFDNDNGVLAVRGSYDGGDQAVYYLDEGRVMVDYGAGGIFYLTGRDVYVKSLRFKYLKSLRGGRSIKIDFVIDHINPESKKEYEWSQNISGVVSLRTSR